MDTEFRPIPLDRLISEVKGELAGAAANSEARAMRLVLNMLIAQMPKGTSIEPEQAVGIIRRLCAMLSDRVCPNCLRPL